MHLLRLLAWLARAPAALAFVLAVGLASTHASARAQDDAPLVDYERQIRPIMVKHCDECHGPDEDAREAELRLDRHSDFAVDLGDGLLIVQPGDMEASYMMERILAEDEFDRMPPDDFGPRLSDEEVDLLSRWIEQGAKAETVVEAMPEAAKGAAKEAAGDTPAASEAATLAVEAAALASNAAALAKSPAEQRASWTGHWAFARPQLAPALAGLSPTEIVDQEIDRALLAAGIPAAPAASKERWLRRLCFDLAGRPPWPAELAAYLSDDSADADTLVVDRLLDSPDCAARLANHWAARAEGRRPLVGPSAEAWRAWLREAFAANLPMDRLAELQLAGDQLADAGPDGARAAGFVRAVPAASPTALPERERQRADQRRVRALFRLWMSLEVPRDIGQTDPRIAEPFGPTDLPLFAAYFADLSILEPMAPPKTSANQGTAKAADAANGAGTLNASGTPDGSGTSNPAHATTTLATPSITDFLPALPETRDRIHLARWLMDPQHPLTARVVIDHFWRLLFRHGLSDGFDPRGEPPLHPQMLDALAVDLITHGWDLRRSLRGILLSAAYRRSSEALPEMRKGDPEGRLLSYQPRRRLEPSMLLTQARRLSGLERSPAGTSRDTPLAASLAAALDETTWTDLALREHPYFLSTARAFGTRLLHDEASTVRRLIRGFRECTSREPDDHELLVLVRLYQRQFNRYIDDEQRSRDVLGASAGIASDYSIGERAAWTTIASVLLCLDETLHR